METNKFNVDVSLVGTDGNAFMLLGTCSKAARKAGIEDTKINKFLDEAKQGDYDHLLRTCMKYFNVN